MSAALEFLLLRLLIK